MMGYLALQSDNGDTIEVFKGEYMLNKEKVYVELDAGGGWARIALTRDDAADLGETLLRLANGEA